MPDNGGRIGIDGEEYEFEGVSLDTEFDALVGIFYPENGVGGVEGIVWMRGLADFGFAE